MRMQQTLEDFESALAEETQLDRQLARARVRQATVRTRRRYLEQQSRRGTMRFMLLVLMLLATAVGVTIAMFQTLYIVMG
jgi:hypothetical protein